ncbi:tRNA(fMet)-specific endonuclease VapC [subsurface metagenome]|nr:PIN domain-containing protein [Methanosarcinales archaeon]
MVDIFLDTSVFIEHMLGNYSIGNIINKGRLFSTINVFEETFYKSIILKTFEKFGKISKYTAKEKYIKNSSYYNDVIMFFEEYVDFLVQDGCLKVLEIKHEIFMSSVKISKRYGLLPNDALIAATCKHYGINKIATTDPDFKRVDFLEIIAPE